MLSEFSFNCNENHFFSDLTSVRFTFVKINFKNAFVYDIEVQICSFACLPRESAARIKKTSNQLLQQWPTDDRSTCDLLKVYSIFSKILIILETKICY